MDGVGLVLTRRPGERILLVLPDESHVWVTVLNRERQDKGSGVVLGVDAPECVGIWREEIAVDKGLVA